MSQIPIRIINHSVIGADYTGVIVAVTASITDGTGDVVGFAMTENNGTADDNIIELTETSGVTNGDSVSLVLDSKPVGTVTISFASADEAIATVSPPALTFTPTDWNVGQAVTVFGVEDNIDGGTSRDGVTAVSSTDPAYNAEAADIAVNVTDNDVAGASIVRHLARS